MMDWVPNPAEFLMDETSSRPLGMRWESWLHYLENYFELIDVTRPSVKRARLLLYAGPEVHKLFDTLPVVEGAADEYEAAKAALNAHFKPPMNPDLATHIFCGTQQEPGEDIYSFYGRLRYLASSCEFEDTDRAIRRQLINGCRREKLRRHVFSNPGIALAEILEVCREWEQKEAKYREVKAMLHKVRMQEEAAASKSSHQRA